MSEEPEPARVVRHLDTAPAERRRARHSVRDSVILTVVSLAAFAVGFELFNNFLMPRLIHSTGEVAVPELSNLTLEQAERALGSTGLVLSRSGERFDPSVPRGFILSQDPGAGTPVRGHTRVLVTVSLGEEFSSVPELFGESRRSAQLLLERAGLRLGAITRAPSEQVGQDLIAGSDPAAESVLPRGTPVSLLVSLGPGPEEYVMPDLAGRELAGARRQLEAFGFKVLVPPGAPSVGAIVTQSPSPGARVTRDAQVILQGTGRMIR
jgi:serine/threonine-protein kinase